MNLNFLEIAKASMILFAVIDIIGSLPIVVKLKASAGGKIESGKAYPSIVTLKNIAEALQTTVGELIGENENFVQHPLLKQVSLSFC